MLIAMMCALLLAYSSCTEIISPDISGETLTILSPVDSLHTDDTDISFWWELSEDVEQYQLRLTSGNTGNISLLLDTLMTANAVVFTLDPDHVYNWQLRGKNEGSETVWETGTFILDQTSPDKATALRMNGDTLNTGATDTIQWQSVDFPIDNLALPVRDSLILYRKNDSTTVGARIFFGEYEARELPITSTSPTPLNGAGTYYWKVVSTDRAGNRNESAQFKFTVQ
ncbi:MAG: hypothetical protein AAF570_07435 [Bacteroidota bacterium]